MTGMQTFEVKAIPVPFNVGSCNFIGNVSYKNM